MMGLNADIELLFNDGSVAVNSATVSVFSSVLRAAVEANASTFGSAQGSNASMRSSCFAEHVHLDSKPKIPIADVSRDEWVEVAAFWYPVVPSPVVADWEHAELLLRVATQYDIPLVLHKVDVWLESKAKSMTAPKAASAAVAAATPSDSVWKWLRLADRSGLTVCLPTIAKRAVEVDRAGSRKADNLMGLSSRVLMHMVAALV